MKTFLCVLALGKYVSTMLIGAADRAEAMGVAQALCIEDERVMLLNELVTLPSKGKEVIHTGMTILLT